MKTILTSMVLASATAFAQQAAPEPTLKPGSELKIEAVSSAKWIQGEPLKAFEPGKVYMFECWATWCGPCIAAIPHVNELHKKYFDKGLRVYGMNVWEDGEDKVTKFVKGKGDGMSYPVAYTGKDSAFETEWLKPAGIRGIPHAFIVKDGKLLFTTHPSQLTDKVIEALLSGDEGVKKAGEELTAAKEAQATFGRLMTEFQKASKAGDADTMAAKLAEIEKAMPASPYISGLKLDVLIARKNWPAATKAVEEMPESSGKNMTISMTAQKIATKDDGDYSVDFVKAVTKAYATILNDPKAPANPYATIILCTLQWKAGDQEAAMTSAKKAAEAAVKVPADDSARKLPAAPFEKLVKSMEGGTMPTMQEFSGWMREGMVKPPAPAPKADAPAIKE